MVAAASSTTPTTIERADEAAFAWASDAESLYRAALNDAKKSGDAAQQIQAWVAFAGYLYRRARNRPAVLAYATVWELAQKVKDVQSTRQGALGISLCLTELDDKAAALAAKIYLGQLAGAEWAQLPRRLQKKLRDPLSVLKSSIKEIRRALPDFERRFLAGEIGFDQPEDFVDLFTRRARHHQSSLLTKAWQLERDAYRRQFLRRLIWPALPLIALAALYALGWLPIGNWIIVVIVLLLVAIYSVFWISSVRAAWRWVSAKRKLSSMDPLMNELSVSTSTHPQAVSILERFAKGREPFALYLRSFEAEAVQSLTPKGVVRKGSSKQHFIQNALLSGSPTGGYIEADQWVVSYLSGPSDFEKYLGTHLSKLLPVVTIANPSASLGRAIVPRLEMEHEAWQRAVRLLMSAAHFIVIEPARNSAGVYQELELTKHSNRHADTIVVLPCEKTRSSMDDMRKLAGMGFEQPVGPTSKFVDANDPILSGFPRIVEDAIFADRDPATLQIFRDVLPDGPTTSPETYSERRRERNSLRSEGTLLHVLGVDQLDRRQPKEANDLFQRAIEILVECDDLAYQAMPLSYQGRAAKELGDLAKAERCFAEAAKIQRETGPPLEYIGSVHHSALLHLDRNDPNQARTAFEEMLEASRHWRYERGQTRAAEGLAMCAFAFGNRHGAVEQLREALKVAVDPRDVESISQALSVVEAKLREYTAAAEHDSEGHSRASRNEIIASYNVAVLELESGQVATALEKLNQALATSRELSLADVEQSILFRIGMAYSQAGQNGPAIDALRQSADLSRQRGDEVHTALAQSNIGTLLVRDGKIPDGIEALREAEQLQRAQGDDGELAYTVDGLGNAYFQQGQYDSSLACDAEALRLHREQNHPDRVVAVMERIGLAQMYLSNFAEAKAVLLEAAKCAGDAGNKQQQATDLALSARLAVVLGDANQGSDLFAQSIALWEKLGDKEQAEQVRTLAQRGKGSETLERRNDDL